MSLNNTLLLLLTIQRNPNPKPGIQLIDVLSKRRTTSSEKRIRVIPGGMGLTNMAHLLTDPNVDILPGLDFDYVDNDASFEQFVHHMLTNEPMAVDTIIAGSRGAELIARILEEDPLRGTIHERFTILLFGPVHLNRIVPSSNNKIVIVHGVHDTNDRIKSVRAYTERHQPHVTLIEVDNKGHNLAFEQTQHLLDIVYFEEI